MSDEIKVHGHVKYKPEYCDMLIDHMSEGYSFDSFVAISRVGLKTMYNWCKEYPEFAEAHQIGQGMALKYFETAIKAASMSECIDEKVLKEKFDPKKINVPTMQWFIKNRFHSAYSEKNITVLEGGLEIKNKSEVDISKLSLAELKALRDIQAKLAKPTEP